MLNKEDVSRLSKEAMEKLKDLTGSYDGFYISHGCALVMHGLREETNDVDAGVDSKIFDEIKDDYYLDLDGRRINDFVNGLDLHREDLEGVEREPDIVLMDGVPVATLNQVIKEKKELGREKDFEQIKLIETYMKNQSK